MMAAPDSRAMANFYLWAQQHGLLPDAGAQAPSIAPGDSPDISSGGLLGRLLEQQATQSKYQGEQAASPPSDPNFRQLSRRVLGSQPEGEPIPAKPTVGEPGAPYSANNFAFSAWPQDPNESYYAKPKPPWFLPSQAAVAAAGLLGGRLGRGISFGSPMPVPTETVPVPMPQIPDWWKAAGAILQMAPKMLSSKGRTSIRARGRSTDSDNDFCGDRQREELGRCEDRRDDYAHQDFEQACKDTAGHRWDLCNRNGGRLPRWEPAEWGPADEEIWFNQNR